MSAYDRFFRSCRPISLVALLLTLSGAACGGGGGNESSGTGGSGTGGAMVPGTGGAKTDAGSKTDSASTDASGGNGSDGPAEVLVCPTSDAGNAPPADAADAPDQLTFQANVAVSTLAGSDAYGTMDGDATIASFENPVSVVVEPQGSLLVCDYDSDRVRRVASDGSVTTLTKQAGFMQPFGMGYGRDGTLYVATDFDPSGHKTPQSGTIWKLDPTSGVATTMASDMGRARGFAALPDGRLVVANYETSRIYLVDPSSSAISELAGQGVVGCPGSFAEGTATGAAFSSPYGIVVLHDGRIIVADHLNHRLRTVTLDGQVTTYAGDGGSGTIDGPRLSSRFAAPKALAVDDQDNVYVSDDVAHRIRRVGADGTVTTVAGDGNAGWKDGSGAEAQFFGQEGLAISGDGRVLFVADGGGGEDQSHNRIRKIQLGP